MCPVLVIELNVHLMETLHSLIDPRLVHTLISLITGSTLLCLCRKLILLLFFRISTKMIAISVIPCPVSNHSLLTELLDALRNPTGLSATKLRIAI